MPLTIDHSIDSATLLLELTVDHQKQTSSGELKIIQKDRKNTTNHYLTIFLRNNWIICVFIHILFNRFSHLANETSSDRTEYNHHRHEPENTNEGELIVQRWFVNFTNLCPWIANSDEHSSSENPISHQSIEDSMGNFIICL